MGFGSPYHALKAYRACIGSAYDDAGGSLALESEHAAQFELYSECHEPTCSSVCTSKTHKQLFSPKL